MSDFSILGRVDSYHQADQPHKKKTFRSSQAEADERIVSMCPSTKDATVPVDPFHPLQGFICPSDITVIPARGSAPMSLGSVLVYATRPWSDHEGDLPYDMRSSDVITHPYWGGCHDTA
jgi:hypothetical protein